MKMNRGFGQGQMAICRLALIAVLSGAASCGEKPEGEAGPPSVSSAKKEPPPVPSSVAPRNDIEEAATAWDRRLAEARDIEGRVAIVREIQMKRSIEAVPFLVKHLTDIRPAFALNALDFDQTLPCTSALIAIGEPSVGAVAQQFGRAKTELERFAQLYVLARIKGGQWTSSFLDERIAEAETEEDKEKLRSFHEWARSYP